METRRTEASSLSAFVIKPRAGLAWDQGESTKEANREEQKRTFEREGQVERAEIVHQTKVSELSCIRHGEVTSLLDCKVLETACVAKGDFGGLVGGNRS